MKSIKTAFAGALALAAGAILANAQTVVHFTGSTAYRGAVHNALLNANGSTVWDSAPSYGYTGAAIGSAGASIFSGTIGGSAVIVKCTWTGSEAGNQTVSQSGSGTSIFYVLNTPTVSGSATALSPSGTPGLDDPTGSDPGTHPSRYEFTIPDVAMSDSFQSSSAFFTTGSNTYHGHTYPALTGATGTGVLAGGVVGIVPFEFVASSSATGYTNITSQQVRTLLTNGIIAKSILTGSSADSGYSIYAVGRDPDSGTRLTTLAETGFGAQNPVVQFEPLDSGNALITATNSTIAILQPWPDETVNGILISSPNGGYNSGGKLAGALGSNSNGLGDLIGYVSTGDAGTATDTTHGNPFAGKILTYNGVAFSTAAVQQGSYTFWSYEHMYYRSGSSAATIANKVATNIAQHNATILTSSMVVNRSTDGATVNPN